MKRKEKEIDKEGLNEIIHLSQKLLRVFYICLIIAIFLGIIIAIKELKIYSIIIGIIQVISPLFIGFILTWLFHPLYKKMVDKFIPDEEKKRRLQVLNDKVKAATLRSNEKYIGKTSAEVSKRWTEHIKSSLNIGGIKK